MILSCEHLTISYEDVAVSDVSFTVSHGDFLCIVGENGSGKTTLIKSILGLIPHQTGSIRLEEGCRIGYVPQQMDLQKDFPASVMEIVLSGCHTHLPFYTKADKRLARKNMQLLGISSLEKQCYRALSGGQQQRVLIARALCSQKGMLVLDEPVTGLDPLVSAELYALLATLCRQENLTVIMVSHDIQAAAVCADYILHLDKTILFYGKTADYLNSDCGKHFLGGSRDA